MKDDDFWFLVEQAKASREDYRRRLKTLTQEELVELYWTFEETAAELRGDRHATSFPAGMSEDAMGDLSLWIVSQGRAVYEDILTNPSRLRSCKGGPVNYLADVVREYEARYKTYVPLKPS